MLSLEPIFLEDIASPVGDISELVNSSGHQKLTLHRPQPDLAINHLNPIWTAREVNLSDIRPTTKFFSERDYSRLSLDNTITSQSYVSLGCPTAYKIEGATAIPSLRHVLIGNGLTVSERFGDKSSFYANMDSHGEYFGYSSQSDRFDIDLQHPHFQVFNNVKIFKSSDYIPIVLSNDSNDKCFAHWFMSCLCELYYLINVISQLERPLLVFSYQPLSWQIETIQHLFPSDSLGYIVITTPVQFPFAILVGGIREHWFHGSYFSFAYRAGKKISFNSRHTRIFISRDDAVSRRITNQREINHHLLRFGFSIIEMGKFTYQDQINLIKSAEIIIFINGSSAMNMIYASAHTKIGMIGASGDYPGTWSRSLANFGIFDLQFFEADRVSLDLSNIGYHINSVIFEKWISRLVE
jgi:hypothetical protein